MRALDLFAGPGGWDEGVREFGIEPLGIEWDSAACETRKAVGHATIHGDVASAVVEHGGMSFNDHAGQLYHHWPEGSIDLLIGSPPCQAFSAAGKGDGHKDVPVIMQTARALGEGRDIRESARNATVDDRSLLVGRQMAEGEGENVGGWGYERPATTIAGDSRVFQPGGHHEPGKQSQNAVRVTLQEAAILQGFPPDYPFQGSRTKQFEQVGNAVPPPLARAVVQALVADALEAAA